MLLTVSFSLCIVYSLVNNVYRFFFLQVDNVSFLSYCFSKLNNIDMDSSTPYVEIPLSMQHPSVPASKERVSENDFQQISSQTLLDFLPSLHNVPKG